MTWDALLPRNAARLMRGGGRPALAHEARPTTDVTFSFFAPRNSAVNLVGDFTTWGVEAMQPDDRGWWHAERSLADGVYRYRFQVQSVNPPAGRNWVNVTDPRTPCLTTDKTANCICIAGGQVRGDNYV